MLWTESIDDPWSTGWYTVNQTRYADKLTAMMSATKENTYIEWNFHQEKFSKVNWTKRPNKTLKDLYRDRAQTLRDNYDHLLLYYSGGSDCHTALQSFINNGIHLDEIYTNAPILATEGWFVPNPLDNRVENNLSEYFLVTKPVLKQLQITNPKIKITINDWSENLVEKLNRLDEKDFITVGTQYFSPGSMLRQSDLSTSHARSINSGHKAACIIGIDKPRITIRDNQAYVYFLDIHADAQGSRKYKNAELFFWSPDCTELLIEQCHILLDFFRKRPDLHYLLDFNYKLTPKEKHQLDRLKKILLYPDWNIDTFQANKPQSYMLYPQIDDWVFDRYRHTPVMKNWQSATNNVIKAIDPKFVHWENDRPTGFVGCISPFYHLGEFLPS